MAGENSQRALAVRLKNNEIELDAVESNLTGVQLELDSFEADVGDTSFDLNLLVQTILA